MTDKIWIDNYQVLYDTNKLTDFFPIADQSKEERLNSIVRLSFYTSIVLSIYHSNFKYLFIFVLALFLTWIIYSKNTNTENTETNSIEKLENNLNSTKPANCVKPTLANPFMNATMQDYMNFDANGNTKNKPEACDPNDPVIKKDIDYNFNNDLYKDVSDVFGKMNSQRQFYTMPSTTIPNDRESFAKWLYDSPQTCKENQNYCLKTEDVRSKRYIFPDPSQNPVDTKRLAQK